MLTPRSFFTVSIWSCLRKALIKETQSAPCCLAWPLSYFSSILLSVWHLFNYLDDLAMGDRQPTVTVDVQRVKEIGKNMGLTVNVGKCELFCRPNRFIADPLLLSFTRRSINDERCLSSRHSTFHRAWVGWGVADEIGWSKESGWTS